MTTHKKNRYADRSSLSRRSVLALAGASTAATVTAPQVVRAQGPLKWIMVTSWPRNLPGPGVTAERLAQRISQASGGALEVKVSPAGELVPALGVFDAVQGGVAQMAHTASFFWQAKMPAAPFFTAVPFGLTAPEHASWIYHGGGQAEWDRLYAPFGIKPFMAGNTGMQMGGWYRKPVESAEDLKGLRIRMPGLGGLVYRKLGASPVTLAPGEIYASLDRGAIDATEFLGPWSDLAQGFYQAAKTYYTPGFHEPNGTGEALIALDAFEALSDDLKAVVEQACATENAIAVAEADWMNGAALKTLIEEHGVDVRPFPQDIIAAARVAADEVMIEQAERDEAFARILTSYASARERMANWFRIGTGNYLDARGA